MESRAKELIEMLALPQLIPLAMKYASKLGRIHLAEKLGELLNEIEEKYEEVQSNHLNDKIEENHDQIQNKSPLKSISILKKAEQAYPKITPVIKFSVFKLCIQCISLMQFFVIFL